MHHDIPLISTIAVSLAFALIGGFLVTLVKLPPVVGYLLAGIVVGPFTPGFIADRQLAPQLAEIGVILLMFGVGLHFSLADLIAVRRIAVPGAILQIGFATVLGFLIARSWGLSLAAALVFGLSLSIASTVMLLRALEGRNEVHTESGRIAVGWLIVEDLVTVFVLVLLPSVGTFLGDSNHSGSAASASWTDLLKAIGLTTGKLLVFVLLMFLAGNRVIGWLLRRVESTGYRELFTLAVAAVALSVAYVSSEWFGFSMALGAFLAGGVINGSEVSHRAARDLQPLQDVFAALFFVSVGMLFDPGVIARQPFGVLITVAIIVLGKSVAAFLIVVPSRGLKPALTIGASLAQIGEFSFILAELGVSLKILPEEARNLILAGALVSIVLNPLLFLLTDLIRPSRTGGASPVGPASIMRSEAG